MKYYFIEIVTKNGEESRGLFVKESLEDALKSYHNSLAYNIGLDGVECCLAIIMTDYGDIYQKERWEKPEEPEEEVE